MIWYHWGALALFLADLLWISAASVSASTCYQLCRSYQLHAALSCGSQVSPVEGKQIHTDSIFRSSLFWFWMFFVWKPHSSLSWMSAGALPRSLIKSIQNCTNGCVLCRQSNSTMFTYIWFWHHLTSPSFSKLKTATEMYVAPRFPMFPYILQQFPDVLQRYFLKAKFFMLQFWFFSHNA